ncbi:hypothetical protein VTK56DRAFT_1887 [Thermocarpiscus australiensis]
MYDNRTHPLLQQVPLTVSPFIHLPTATTLPYTYKPMPSTLPPSAAGIAAEPPTTSLQPTADAPPPPPPKPKYVVSPSGHRAHPDDILAECRALHAHVAQLQAQAGRELAALEERIRARELAEKRRVAPGWLDSDARLLEPERKGVLLVGGVVENGVGTGKGSGGGGGLDNSGQQHQDQQQMGQEQRFDGEVGGLGYEHEHGHGPGVDGRGPGGTLSEMAVPDEGEELDRAFGKIHLGRGS